MESDERAEVWNTYFILAREQALKLKNATDNPLIINIGGGILSEINAYKLSTILMCNLAIEARINHLFFSYKDEIPKTAFEYCLRKASTIEKWFLLPYFVKNIKIDFDKKPHNAIKDIHSFRDNLVHVRYETMEKKLKKITKQKTLKLFTEFVNAMEDMNVILNRGGRTEAKPEVLKLGDLSLSC